PGRTPYLQHRIHTNSISYVKPYRLAESELDKAQKICDEMEEKGVIKRSNSPFNLPIVLVSKPSGESRFRLNLQALNKITVPCHFPTDQLRDCYDSLGSNNFYFSQLDVLAAYWSIGLHPNDTHKTAFTVRTNKYEFLVTPFGLTASPYSWAMLINMVLGSAKHSYVLSYVDDLLVYTKNDWNLHLHHVQDIFSRLSDANLRLKISKCKFGTGECTFLGHVVSREGLKCDPKKVEAVTKLARPVTKKQVRSFLGMCGFYRAMIPRFSMIAQSLHDLTKLARPERVVWKEEHQKAFDDLKKALTSKPVLKFPCFDLEFILRTDASRSGIGGVLMQDFGDGVLSPIA
ncbi:unnamed protein product, partial [Heterosigma akashiwo]